MDRLRNTTFLFAALAILIGGRAHAADRQALSKALANPALFGKDAPLALASLSAWQHTGGGEIELYTDRMVGSRKFKDEAEAKKAAEALGTAVVGAPPKWNKEFDVIAKRVPPKLPLRTVVVPHYDDDVPHVALTGAKLIFFPAGLAIATVEKQLGPAEKVSTIAVQGVGDHRPVILTIHSYFGGALQFAESDFDPKRGVVNRIIIPVSIGGELFQGVQ